MGPLDAALGFVKNPAAHTLAVLVFAVLSQLHQTNPRVLIPQCASECAAAVGRIPCQGSCSLPAPEPLSADLVCPVPQRNVLVLVVAVLGCTSGLLLAACVYLGVRLVRSRHGKPHFETNEAGLLEVGKRRPTADGGPLHHLSVAADHW